MSLPLTDSASHYTVLCYTHQIRTKLPFFPPSYVTETISRACQEPFEERHGREKHFKTSDETQPPTAAENPPNDMRHSRQTHTGFCFEGLSLHSGPYSCPNLQTSMRETDTHHIQQSYWQAMGRMWPFNNLKQVI